MRAGLTSGRRGSLGAASALAGLAVVWLALSASIAAAGKPRLDSTISYRNSVDSGFYIHEGRVRSTSPACERGRTVLLFAEGFDQPFNSDRTDAQGRYRFMQEQDSIATDYYTRVRLEEKPSVICKAAESPHKPLRRPAARAAGG